MQHYDSSIINENNELILSRNSIRILNPKIVKRLNKSQAVFIQQLHYWIQKGSGVAHEGKRWIYNTAEEWADQIMVCERQARRIICSLKKLGVLQVQKLSRIKSNRTNYFTIDYDALEKILSSKPSSSELNPDQETFLQGTPEDKMSISPGQNVRMVKQRELTNIENKLIEETASEGIHEQEKIFPTRDQVKPVIKIDPRIREGRQKDDKAPPKTTIAQDMLEIWNKHFPSSKATMTKDLARYLVSAYKRFGSNLDKWRHYCDLIESSPYLTGEGFSLSIQWAVKFSTIDRILNGEFQVSQRALSYIPSEDILMQQAQDHISSLKEKEAPESLHLRHLVLKKYGAAAYQSWFTKVNIMVSKGIVTIEADSQFLKEYIKNKFLGALEKEPSCLRDSNPHSIWGSQNAA